MMTKSSRNSSKVRDIPTELEDEHNVYIAEVTAFELAVSITQISFSPFTKCVIYADSQAVIKGISSSNKQSEQEVLISTINKIDRSLTQGACTLRSSESKWARRAEHGRAEPNRAEKYTSDARLEGCSA